MLAPLLLLAQAASAAKTVTLATKTFPASKITRIEVRTESGAIRLSARAGAQTRVEAFKPASSEGHCDLKLSLDDGTLTLEARKPKGSAADCDGGFSVSAPAGASLEAYSGSGAVEADGLRGTLKARTGSGDVKLRGLRGEAYVMTGSGVIDAELPTAAFDARTGSGDIRVKLLQAGGLVSARSGSGSVTVTLPAGAKAHIRATTASGKITDALPDTKDAPLVVEAFSGSGDITIKTAP